MARRIRLPDIRQADGHDCGEAAIRCVVQHHTPGAAVVLNLATPHYGLDPATMESVFRGRLGWCVSAGERTLDELAYYANDGRPVVCPVQRHGTGHYVVVGQVTGRRVYFHDPTDGPAWLTVTDWIAGWTDEGRFGAEFWRFGLVAWPRR